MHDDMGIIYKLPVGCKAGNKAVSAFCTIVEVYQVLVGALQDNIVSSVLLFLQVQIVDVCVSTND